MLPRLFNYSFKFSSVLFPRFHLEWSPQQPMIVIFSFDCLYSSRWLLISIINYIIKHVKSGQIWKSYLFSWTTIIDYEFVLNSLQTFHRKRPKFSWRDIWWMLHHDNTLALLFKQFLKKHNTIMMPQSPDSPDTIPLTTHVNGHSKTVIANG